MLLAFYNMLLAFYNIWLDFLLESNFIYLYLMLLDFLLENNFIYFYNMWLDFLLENNFIDFYLMYIEFLFFFHISLGSLFFYGVIFLLLSVYFSKKFIKSEYHKYFFNFLVFFLVYSYFFDIDNSVT
jgi:hypothetical protein